MNSNSFGNGNPLMLRWRDKIALVTGASSGIGEATARALASAGMRVVLVARRMERLQALKAELEAGGAKALCLRVDLRDEAAISAMFAEVRKSWGTVDVLIANAGLGRLGKIPSGDTGHWREMTEVNLLGFAFCLREALEQMQGKELGQIVGISSLAGHRVPLGRPSVFYAATKHAMRAIMDGLRAELAEAGSPLKVGMVSPGMVATEFQHTAAGLAEGETFDYGVPVLTPEDIAEAVVYLLSTPPEVQVHDILMRSVAQLH